MATLGNTTITNLNSGTIRIQPVLGSYQEGIRIQPYASWSTIMLLGTDSTASAGGTSAKSWGIFNNDGNFYINKNASNTQQRPRLWGHNNGFTIGNTNLSSYALNTASFICGSWIRTKGATGWYNEDYGGGWYMTDTTAIRNYNSKAVALDNNLSVGGTSTFTGKTTHNGGIGTTSLSASSTLAVTGTSTFTGKTTHNGGIDVSTVSVTNSATIGGNLIFSSATPYIKFNTSNTVLAYDGTELRLGTSSYKTRIKGSSVAVDSLCSFNAGTKSASFSSEVEFKGGGTHTDICPSIATGFKAKRIMANEAILGIIYLGASTGTASNTALTIKKYGAVSDTAPTTTTDLVTISTAGKITAVGGFEGTASTVAGSYTSNGGQQNPNYFGNNKVGFLMMNTTVNGNSHYKDWLIMDCYSGGDVGGGVAFGVNRQKLGAYIMRSAAERTSWAESAELIGTHNYTSYAATSTHKHTFTGSSVTTSSTNGHTPAGTVSLSGSLSSGTLTITASFAGSAVAAHTHTVTAAGTISTPTT